MNGIKRTSTPNKYDESRTVYTYRKGRRTICKATERIPTESNNFKYEVIYMNNLHFVGTLEQVDEVINYYENLRYA